MRRGRRSAWLATGAVAVGLALVIGVSFAVRATVSRREAMMRTAADAAGVALRAARAEDAMRWAPEELATAEQASREALTRQRIEQVRAWPVPDAASVVDAWSAAQRAARAATESARARHAAGANSATEQIDRAREAVAAGETVASTIYLGPDRRLLATAHTALDQSRAYQRAGDSHCRLGAGQGRGVTGRAGAGPRGPARGALRRRRHAGAVAALEERHHRLVET